MLLEFKLKPMILTYMDTYLLKPMILIETYDTC